MSLPDSDNPFAGLGNLADKARDTVHAAHASVRARRLAIFGGGPAALIVGYCFVVVSDGLRAIPFTFVCSIATGLAWVLVFKLVPKGLTRYAMNQLTNEELIYNTLSLVCAGAALGPFLYAAKMKWPPVQSIILMVSVIGVGATIAIVIARRVGRPPRRADPS